MEKGDYIKNIIAERGEEYYNENKFLLDAEYEYIQSLGDIDDIAASTSPLISTGGFLIPKGMQKVCKKRSTYI